MFLFGTVLCCAAPSLNFLILGRVFEGLGACAGIVLARAIIRDVYEREAAARGLALVMMEMTLAPAISPALGAYLSEWIDWRAIFLLLYRQRAASARRHHGRAAEHLWADDPLADGDLHAWQRSCGPVCVPVRQPHTLDMRARPGLRWGDRDDPVVFGRRGGHLGDVPNDRLYRDR